MRRIGLMTLITVLLLLCIVSNMVAVRQIIEYDYNLTQTATNLGLTYTATARRMSNAGMLVPAVNRLTATNASHNIYFKIVDTALNTRTNVYWHKTGRYEYEWIDTEIPPGSYYSLGMRRNTSDTNTAVTARGSWSPDLNDVIID